MDRRQLLKGIGSTLLVQRAAAQAKPPNIVYLHSHDTGRYIQPYGFPVPTPNMQRFAEEAVVFRQAFSGAPTCSPSRASLLTGQCAHSNGMLGLAHRGFSLYDYRRHILHTLRAAGYSSTLIGVQHIARDPQVIGYSEIVPTANTRVASVAPAASRFIRNPPTQPFYVEIGFMETHREFREPSAQDREAFCVPPRPIPDHPRTRHDMAAFNATARELDNGVGAVLTAIEQSGLAANTLVISTTDHGVAFPAMKCNLTVHGTGVLLMMRGPGGFTGGKVSDALVSQVDLFPTICELTGMPAPSWLQGRSLMPLIRGEKTEIREQVFSEVNYHAAYEPMRSVRTPRWNYIRRFGDRRTPVLPNCDDSISKNVWLENGWAKRTLAVEELYDAMFDPNESRNLADDAASAQPLKEMRKRLDDWMTETSDPLLKGPIGAPPGAEVNDPNGTSPREPTIRIGS